MTRLRKRPGLVAALVAALLVGKAAFDTLRDPVVHRATLALPDVTTPGVRVLMMADLHVAGPDMPPARLRRMVDQANRLQPDLVLLAGDFISDRRLATTRYSFDEALAPLDGLTARLGRVAVLGNHDHWRDAPAARAALTRHGITVLVNDAVRRGPLTIGGVDDDFTGNARVRSTLSAMERFGPPYLLLSHSPDPFPEVPKSVALMLAGHTHCGQIRLPILGAITHMSRHGARYGCGLFREGERTLIVSAGLGTSILPVRFGTQPDMWLITLVPKERRLYSLQTRYRSPGGTPP